MERYQEISNILNSKVETLIATAGSHVATVAEYNALYEQQGLLTDTQRMERQIAINSYDNLIKDKEEFEKLSAEIKTSAGLSIEMTKKRNEGLGDPLGAIGNSVLKGIEDIVKGAWYLETALEDVIDMGISMVKYTPLGEVVYEDVDFGDFYKDSEGYRGREKSRKERMKDIEKDLTNSLVDKFGSATTEEYIGSENRSDITKAATGVAGSLPAMATGFGGMFLQSFGAVSDEWVKNPDFEKMPLNDLLVVGGSIAVIQGTLEKVGLTSVLAKNPLGKSLTNKIVQSTIGKITGPVTKKKFNELLAAETNSYIKNGVVKIVGGALVEAETGGLQEIADIGIKMAYNNSEGKSLFVTPETFSEGVAQVKESAKMEAIGGALMKGTMLAPKMMSDGIKSLGMNKAMTESLHFLKDSPELKRSLIKKIKMEVLQGRMTKAEAKTTLEDFDNVMTTMREIPQTIKDKESAFDLVIEKKRLIKEIEGKDKALVVDKTERIAEIDAEMNTIARTAPDSKPEDDYDAAIDDVVNPKRNKPTTPGAEVEAKKTEIESRREVMEVAGAEPTQQTGDVEAKKAEIEKREKRYKDTQEKVDREYQEENWTEEEKEWNKKVGDELIVDDIIDIRDQLDKRTDKSKNGIRVVTHVIKKGTAETQQRVDITKFDSQEAADKWVKEKAERILNLHQKHINEVDAKKAKPVKDDTSSITKPSVDQVSIHKDNGGSSISQTGEDLFGKPGYSVSTHTDKTKTVNGKEVTQQELDQYKEDNKEALKDPNNFVGTWYDSKTDQTYIDIATKVDNKQEAIELGKANNQKAIFDLESGTEIDTGGTGEVTAVTEAQPATEESMRTKFKETKGDRQQQVVRAALRVVKSLRNISGLKIYVHDNTDAYNSAIAKSTGESKESIDTETQKSTGEYLFGKKEIHINLDNATSGTVYHEAFHAIFEAKGFSEAQMKSFVGNVKKISNLSASTIAKLDRFADNYTAESAIAAENSDRASKGEPKLSPKEEAKIREEHVDTVGEEFVAELFSDLATDATTMSASNLQKLINLVNKLAKSIGLGVVLREGAKRQEVIDFLNKTATDLSAGLGVDVETEINTGSIKTKRKKQAENLFMSGDKKFKSLKDIASFLNSWSQENRLFDDKIENMPEDFVADKFADHILKEIRVWEKVKGSEYIGFYDEDIPNRLNPALQDFAKKQYGRELNNEEISLYHIVSSFASPSADPIFDSSKGLEVFNKFMETGELSAYGEAQATVWATDKKGKRYDTGKPKFNTEGKPVFKQVAKAYAVSSLDKVKKVIDNFNGDINKAVKWLESTHTYEESSKMMGTPLKGAKSLKQNEYFTKENGGFGVFAVTGVKLGSYILNRVGEHSTVTKDMWYARTMARLSGESLFEKGGAIKQPWGLTKVGVRKRIIADKAFGIVAKELGTTPSDVQQKIWDFEKRLYENLGSIEKTGYASEGFKKKAKEITDSKPSVSRKKRVMPKNESEKLTVDKDGNYYFENFAHSKKTTLKPSLATGVGTQTSKEERDAINSVGGLTMLYTMKGQTEKNIGTNKHKVVIPKDKVYYIQDDVNNYYDEAKRQFSEARPGQAFNPNYEGAWITKVANENGYDIAITKWRDTELRAQTTLDLKPTESDTEFIERIEDTYKVGDNIFVYGDDAKVTGVDGDVVSFKHSTGGGTINVVNSKRSIRKKQLADSSGLDKAVTEAKEKYNISVKRGNTKEQAIASAIGDLKKTDWYSNTDDIQREKALRQLDKSLGVKQKSAPSVAKTLGTAKDKVTINERVALRELIQREVRAAREGAKSEKDIRKAINNIVTVTMAKMTGKIKPAQVRSLVKRALTMNLSNPVMAERFINYVEKVAKDSAYEGKLQLAYKARKRFKKLSKSPSQQHELKNTAKDFSSIDPLLVEDIDAYIEKAEMLKAALTSTRVIKDEVKYRDVSGVNAINEFTSKALEQQEQMRKNAMEIEFSDLFEANILNSDMSIVEMMDIIDGISRSTQQTIKNENNIREQVKNAFEAYASIIEHIVKTNTDPLTGEDYDMSKAQRKAVGSLIDLDIDSLSLQELFQVVDLISNFTVNNAVGNIESVANLLEGRKSAEDFSSKHGSSMKMNVVGRGYARTFMSLTMLMDNVFASTRKSIDFFKMSGLGGFVRGANYAQRVAEKTLDRFAAKFGKTKPNGESFNTAKNTYERGMYGFLLRNTPGTPTQMAAEFRRRVRLIEDSITYLNSKNSTVEEKKKGVIYKELYIKLGVGDIDSSIETITKAVAKDNVEAVQWWVNEWSNHYGDLKDVTSSVYNRDLGSDMNYTTDTFKKSGGVAEDISSDIEGAFVGGNGNVYHKEAGVLMESTNPSILPKGRVIDLDFDSNNYIAMESALVDINTAAEIKKLIGFMNSESFNDIFNADDRDMIRKRITQYVLRKRKKEMSSEHVHKVQSQVLNTFAKASTALALGSIAQLPKQTLSVIANTIINAGTIDFRLTDAFDKNINDWLDNSGMPISRRGVEADVALDFANKNLKKYTQGKKKAMDVVDTLSSFWLKKFLANPDRTVARASFVTYYKVNLKKRGKSTDVNFKEPMDQDAADYAQHMVDRQQNISDTDMAGDFFTSKGNYANIVRKFFFPFANFIMNQKSRMYSDFRTILSKTNTAEDKISSVRSLAGLATEMVVFHAVSMTIRSGLKGLANMITGYEPEEEDYDVNEIIDAKKKELKEAGKSPMTKEEELKERAEAWKDVFWGKAQKTFFTSVSKDILSPMPIFDDLIVWGVNKGVRTEESIRLGFTDLVNKAVKKENEKLKKDNKDPMSKSAESRFRDKTLKTLNEDAPQLWNFGEKSFGESYGTAGIVVDKYYAHEEIALAADEGYVEIERNGKVTTKYLLPEDQEIAKTNKWIHRAYLWGVLPADAGAEAAYIQRNLSKSALTEIQIGKYEALKKEQGSVSEEELKIIKNGGKVGSESNKRPARKTRKTRKPR